MTAQLPYLIAFLVAAISMTALGTFVWSRRHVRGGWLVFAFCALAAYWCVISILLNLGLDLETNILLTNLEYLAVALASPLVLVIVCSMFGYEHWLTKPRLVLVFSLPLLTIVAVWTNRYHYLYYTSYSLELEPFRRLIAEHGPLWRVHITYQYVYLLFFVALLAPRLASSQRRWRGQAWALLLAMASLVLGNLIYLFRLGPVERLDTTSISMSIVAAAYAWGIHRHRLLDIAPVARARVFKGLGDPIFVLDDKSRIVDLNPAAETILGDPAPNFLGRELGEILPDGNPLLDAIDSESSEVQIRRDDQQQVYDLVVTPLGDGESSPDGRLIVLHDISARKRLENELATLASTDSLTGISNRRRLLEAAARELAAARRYGRELSVLMLDLDHFKQINDSLGHDVGDRVLQKATAAWQNQLRNVDELGRMGGEEFCVVLPDTGAQGAREVAERLRAALSSIEMSDTPDFRGVTTSIGVASLSEPDATIEALLKRADEALYEAKSRGRDQVLSAVTDDRAAGSHRDRAERAPGMRSKSTT